MTRTELYTQLAQLTDAQLNSLVTLAQSVQDGTLVLPNANKVAKKTPEVKFSAKSLKCTKGIPSKVWSAIHHCVIDNGGTYDRRSKTWNFKTIKACKAVYDAQVAYAKEHGTELVITTC